MAIKKKKTGVKTVKSPKKASKHKKSASKPKHRKPQRVVISKGVTAEPRRFVVVYGMRIEPENITKAAVEAYNKKRYTVHDVRLAEHIEDPKFRNLMVKIAVLDRIEEEVLRIYPDADVLRPNTVTLIIR